MLLTQFPPLAILALFHLGRGECAVVVVVVVAEFELRHQTKHFAAHAVVVVVVVGG